MEELNEKIENRLNELRVHLPADGGDLEIVSIVLGIGICLSYISSIYEDAEDKKIGKKLIECFRSRG